MKFRICRRSINEDCESILCKLHANYKTMIEENERFKQEMETLNSVTKRLNGSLTTEQEVHESLKATHQQVLVIGCSCAPVGCVHGNNWCVLQEQNKEEY